MSEKTVLPMDRDIYLPPATPSTSCRGWRVDLSSGYLLGVARAQKRVLWYFLMGIPLIFALVLFLIFVPSSVMDPLLSAVLVGLVVVSYQIGAITLEVLLASKMLPRWAVIASVIVSAIGGSLFVLLALNWIASALLRANGMQVGILGAKRSDFTRLRDNAELDKVSGPILISPQRE